MSMRAIWSGHKVIRTQTLPGHKTTTLRDPVEYSGALILTFISVHQLYWSGCYPGSQIFPRDRQASGSVSGRSHARTIQRPDCLSNYMPLLVQNAIAGRSYGQCPRGGGRVLLEIHLFNFLFTIITFL